MSAARLTRALREWAGDGPRRRYAEEIAAIYRAYRDGLERRARRRGAVRVAARWTPCAGERRSAWGGTPVFVYGFDDFDGLQLDALELSLGLQRGRDGLAPL